MRDKDKTFGVFNVCIIEIKSFDYFPLNINILLEKENNRIKRFILEIKEVGILIENHLILRSIRPSYTIHRLQRFDALVYRIISR